MLRYSTELEETAISKDAEALFRAAELVIQPQDLVPGKKEAAFFAAGVKFAANALAEGKGELDVHYFTWHGDGETYLFFRGDYSQVVKRIRGLEDRTDHPYR